NKAIRAVFKKIDPKIKFSADDIVLKGSHKIDFKNSSESRKNNIRTALKALDGIVIMPNQTISFNEITGERNETNGYMKAKTIKNGTFIPEFGGGVCQVSTTLYNAAILSGLDIIEVNPHSLPVSYEKPCFDAMVNMGSSDLKIRNNTELPIIIATSDKNDSCLINIYGVKNKYLIVRKSEIINDFIQFQKIKTKNYKEYGYNEPLKKNEEILISNGKKGYRAVGILEYYKDGVLIKTEKIRDNIYNPTKEVLLVGDD
ncbi:MAG: VanW family protein, partial [Clostridia bacterium]|nr:VanW family protein [Clostridia bacterium]